MKLDHIAIWTKDIERLKDFYVKFFNGRSNEKYTNANNGFESYFITFESGARLELMSMPGIAENKNDAINKQHTGIIHLAFGVNYLVEVDEKAKELEASGIKLISRPRVTGDGYYEFETCDPDHNRIEVTTPLV